LICFGELRRGLAIAVRLFERTAAADGADHEEAA
jgi:hypothetical protein